MLKGEAAGTKVGGVLEVLIHDLDIEFLPKNAIEAVTVDVSDLGVGEGFTAADVNKMLGADYKVLTASDSLVVHVVAGKVADAEEAALKSIFANWSVSMKVVIGLGNPGDKYQDTRHNIGFKVVEALADRKGARFRRGWGYCAKIAKYRDGDELVWLVKPNTFMNRSGLTVSSILKKKRVELSDVIVVYDDIDLDWRRLRSAQRIWWLSQWNEIYYGSYK